MGFLWTFNCLNMTFVTCLALNWCLKNWCNWQSGFLGKSLCSLVMSAVGTLVQPRIIWSLVLGSEEVGKATSAVGHINLSLGTRGRKMLYMLLAYPSFPACHIFWACSKSDSKHTFANESTCVCLTSWCLEFTLKKQKALVGKILVWVCVSFARPLAYFSTEAYVQIELVEGMSGGSAVLQLYQYGRFITVFSKALLFKCENIAL